MADPLHIVCPDCDSLNRVPGETLGSGGKGGNCHRPLFAGQPVNLDDSRFARHSGRSDIPLLVDFWAPWCGPCKMMAPVFEQAAAQLEPRMRLAKVNTEQEQALAARFGIRSIPTLVLFQGGREADRVAGAMDLQGLLGWARRYC